ncbi:uncharacterized protein METZ01_LOCUS332531, partial [marine metagenome]
MGSLTDKSKAIAIVGAAESDAIGNVENKSALQLHAEAAHNALEDAGLTKNDVDGLFTAGFSTTTTGEYLGIQPKYTDTTAVGGASFVIHVIHALAAINAGYCEVALITHGQSGRNMRIRGQGGGGGFAEPNQPPQQYESPYGIVGPPVNYAMA